MCLIPKRNCCNNEYMQLVFCGCTLECCQPLRFEVCFPRSCVGTARMNGRVSESYCCTCCDNESTQVCGPPPEQWCCEDDCVLCTSSDNPAACAIPMNDNAFGDQCVNRCGPNSWWVQNADGSMGCQCLTGYTGPDCTEAVPFPWTYLYTPTANVPSLSCSTFGVNASSCCLQLYTLVVAVLYLQVRIYVKRE